MQPPQRLEIRPNAGQPPLASAESPRLDGFAAPLPVSAACADAGDFATDSIVKNRNCCCSLWIASSSRPLILASHSWPPALRLMHHSVLTVATNWWHCPNFPSTSHYWVAAVFCKRKRTHTQSNENRKLGKFRERDKSRNSIDSSTHLMLLVILLVVLLMLVLLLLLSYSHGCRQIHGRLCHQCHSIGRM